MMRRTIEKLLFVGTLLIVISSLWNFGNHERVKTISWKKYVPGQFFVDDAAKELRVLCWVMTNPNNLHKVKAIKDTWGKRCDKLVFCSSVADPENSIVGLGGQEGRGHLTNKTKGGFLYVYEHYFNDYDWFLKTDDDAYVIIENLKYFLLDKDTNDLLYYGHHFKTLVPGGYFSGGPGIVVGRRALQLFAQVAWDKDKCRQGGTAGDAAFGMCLYNTGVRVGNSTDSQGRNRFNCFNPITHLNGEYPNWYYQYDANGAKKGLAAVSDYVIGFHYMTPRDMYAMEYYVYQLRLYRSAQTNVTTNLL